jgi:FkbM family methyltransferase
MNLIVPTNSILAVEKIQNTTEAVLNFVKDYLPDNPIILEAGAFEGTDTIKMSNMWPKGTLYSFEPVPQLFNYVQHITKNILNVYLHNIALSDKNGFAQFHVSELAGRPGVSYGSGSLLAPKEHLKYDPNIVFNHTIDVKTITLDDWAQEKNISQIDFLWLDMQGMELNVLKSAESILRTVKVIYVEVEFIQAYAGQYLYGDVKGWLESKGFEEVARDFDYPPKWYYGNCVFVRKS